MYTHWHVYILKYKNSCSFINFTSYHTTDIEIFGERIFIFLLFLCHFSSLQILKLISLYNSILFLPLKKLLLFYDELFHIGKLQKDNLPKLKISKVPSQEWNLSFYTQLIQWKDLIFTSSYFNDVFLIMGISAIKYEIILFFFIYCRYSKKEELCLENG